MDQMEVHAQESASVVAQVDLALVRAVYVARLAVESGDDVAASACGSLIETLLEITRVLAVIGERSSASERRNELARRLSPPA